MKTLEADIHDSRGYLLGETVENFWVWVIYYKILLFALIVLFTKKLGNYAICTLQFLKVTNYCNLQTNFAKNFAKQHF